VSVAGSRDRHPPGALRRRVIEVLQRSSRPGASAAAQQRRPTPHESLQRGHACRSAEWRRGAAGRQSGAWRAGDHARRSRGRPPGALRRLPEFRRWGWRARKGGADTDCGWRGDGSHLRGARPARVRADLTWYSQRQRARSSRPRGCARLGWTVIGEPESVASGRGPVFLTCPRCRLSIRPRRPWLVIEHCPRCLARARIPVLLFSSPLPADDLYEDRAAAGGPAAVPPVRVSRAAGRRLEVAGDR
jgi:hypothetical protein